MSRTASHKQLLLVAGLAALVLAAYAVCLRFPFVQDDWSWISRFQNGSATDILKSIFTIRGNLFFRPLSGLYLYTGYLVFGANPIPFHIISLAALIVNSLLVTAIMRLITRDELTAISAGFVYASSVAVHMESLLWVVGIYDLGGSFFFLLAMLLFLREHPIWSAGTFLAGCLFKETVIVLPFILVAYGLILAPRRAGSTGLVLGRLGPMAVALIAVAAIKLVGTSPFGLSSSHPYAVAFFGRHILRNLCSYLSWMTQCFDPFLFVLGGAMKFVLNDLLLIFLFCVWLASRRQREEAGELARQETGVLWFLLAWICLALAPCISLPNHTYRYYAMYALPAFIGILFLQARILFESARIGRKMARVLVVLVVAAAGILSILQANIMFREGLRQRTLSDGTNFLIRRATTVEVVRDGLLRWLPSLPRGAVILLGDVEVVAFDGESGLRAWYGDQSICVYPLGYYRNDGTGAYVLVPPAERETGNVGPAPQKIVLDPAKIFAFRLEQTELKPITR